MRSNSNQPKTLVLGPEADAKLVEFEDQVLRFELRIIESIGFLEALRAKHDHILQPSEPLRSNDPSAVAQPTSGPAIANCR